MGRALLFDYFETLVTRPLSRDGGGDGERIGCPESYREVWSEWGERRMTTPCSYRELLEEACARGGVRVTSEVLTALCRDRVERQQRLCVSVESPIVSMLDACRAEGWRTAVVSNASIEDASGWEAGPLAPRFDAVAFSFEVGAMKPDRRVYEVALTRVGARAADAAIVSDAVGDLVGAAEIGIGRLVWATWFLDRRAGTAVDVDMSGDAPGPEVTVVRSPDDLGMALR